MNNQEITVQSYSAAPFSKIDKNLMRRWSHNDIFYILKRETLVQHKAKPAPLTLKFF